MEFSRKYHEESFPERYAGKHRESLRRRLNDRREQYLLQRCLAETGPNGSLADVGCGPGRFWPVLERSGGQALYALDVSHAMLRFARERHAAGMRGPVRLVAGSVLALPFPDSAFDTVVSMRLLHHLADAPTRRQALAELARICRRYLVVSLWTDGNYKAWRRRRLERRRGERAYRNRYIVSRATLLEDFAAAGLEVVRHFDLVPGYSQWRYYVLRPVAPGTAPS